MIFKTSRYYDLCDNARNERLVQRPVVPEEGLLEHTLKAGERLDQIAHFYYEDASAWWRILDANPDILSAADFILGEYTGETIVIPGMKRRR